MNQIFIDLSKREAANSPRYVRNKRKKTILSSSESDEEIDLPDEKEFEKNHFEINDDNQLNENENEDQEELEESNSMQESLELNPISIEDILLHVPHWGGKIKYQQSLSQTINVSNTCTIDYYLFAFWLQFKIIPDFLSKIPKIETTSSILDIIQLIDQINWDGAKEIWINKIMRLSENPVRNTISMFGSEYERFFKYISKYQSYQLVQQCQSNCAYNDSKIIQNHLDEIFFKKYSERVKIYHGNLGYCIQCKKKINCEILFKHQPNFIYIQSAFGKITHSDLPSNVTINNQRFNLLCSTVHKRDHFFGIFLINNNLFLMNDLDRSFNILNTEKNITNKKSNYTHKLLVSSALYYLE